jgi:hypothetical protein
MLLYMAHGAIVPMHFSGGAAASTSSCMSPSRSAVDRLILATDRGEIKESIAIDRALMGCIRLWDAGMQA